MFNITINLTNSDISEIVKDICIPLFSVFLGSILGYFFNARHDKLNTYNNNKAKLLYLHNKLLTIYMDLKICHTSIINKLKFLKNSKLDNIVTSTITICPKMDIKSEDFSFISIYNKVFVISIQTLKDRLIEFNIWLDEFNNYKESIRRKQENKKTKIEYDKYTKKQLKTYLMELKNFSEELLSIAHILLNGLDFCYREFFNNHLDYFDLSSNYLEESFFKNSNLYESNKKSFNNGWMPKSNLKTDIEKFKINIVKKIGNLKEYLMFQ